jgi:hypothetical protein
MVTIPQNVAFEQAKQELVKCVNQCLSAPLNLKMYEIEIILKELHSEARIQMQVEYNENKQAYDEQVKAEQAALMAMASSSMPIPTPIETNPIEETESEN